LANRSCFSDEVEGLRWIGLGVGAVLMVCGLTCALVCKEGKREQAMHQTKVGFRESFVATVKNRTFILLLSLTILMSAGLTLVSGFGGYITIYYLYSGDKEAASVLIGSFGTLIALVSMASIYPMNWISDRIGKRKTTMLFLLVISLGNLIKYWCYNPTYPYLSLVPAVPIAIGWLVLVTLGPSMLADICDEDELKTGIRREGIYNAATGWWLKLGLAIGPFIAGLILYATGFDAELDVQSEHSMFMLRMWDVFLPALLPLVGIYCVKKYPLTEERVYEIQIQLAEKRKQQVQ
jgi:GPH family glycoside/pentoside/hexuronide:cation symporter